MSKTTASEETKWEEPSKQQIAEWKQKYEVDTIHLLKARDERDGSIKKAYCRPPGFEDHIRASQSNKDKHGTYSQSIYENCVLAAHPDIKKVSALYMGILFSMDKINAAAEVTVEKL